MSIGSKINRRRNELDMTEEQLAEKIDVSLETVHAWEQGQYLPETAQLIKVAAALGTKVSWLLNEDSTTSSTRWALKDAMFSIDHMKRKIRDYAVARDMKQTLKALMVMEKYHEGTFRKGKDKVPYIIHPLMMACHSFALGVATDELVATCLLHDVLEDCNASPADLGVSDEIVKAVQLVSYSDIPGLTKDESKFEYYKQISKNPMASMVKLLDRCNNISTMATGFDRDRMAEYIDETEKYVIPLLDLVKYDYDDYNDAAYLLKYHMRSVMETLKRTL